MSLGLLVGRFGNFLRELPEPPPAPQSVAAFPDQLERLRDQFGHHIVLLMLLSRSDGEAAIQERQVILDHCLDQAKRAGMPATAAEAAELGDHLRDLRPMLTQLDHAIARLEEGSKEEVIAVVHTAMAVIDADGVRRERELEFLRDLKRELEVL
jgi:hypothetical protein